MESLASRPPLRMYRSERRRRSRPSVDSCKGDERPSKKAGFSGSGISVFFRTCMYVVTSSKSKNYLQPDEADASTRPLPKCDVPITVNHSLTVGMWNNAPQIQYTHVVYPDCYRCCYCWCRCACYRNNLSACLLLLRCRQTSKHHASIGALVSMTLCRKEWQGTKT